MRIIYDLLLAAWVWKGARSTAADMTSGLKAREAVFHDIQDLIQNCKNFLVLQAGSLTANPCFSGGVDRDHIIIGWWEHMEKGLRSSSLIRLLLLILHLVCIVWKTSVLPIVKVDTIIHIFPLCAKKGETMWLSSREFPEGKNEAQHFSVLRLAKRLDWQIEWYTSPAPNENFGIARAFFTRKGANSFLIGHGAGSSKSFFPRYW